MACHRLVGLLDVECGSRKTAVDYRKRLLLSVPRWRGARKQAFALHRPLPEGSDSAPREELSVRRWYHAPAHALSESGAYMITAGTYQKSRLFHDAERLDLLHDTLLQLADDYELRIQAWAIFSNHYHLVSEAPKDASRLGVFIRHLHSASARALNALDGTPGRRVWYQYWDTLMTHQTSYLARLNYVHHNPVKHGLAADPETYRWCSAGWFRQEARIDIYRLVQSFPTDRVRVIDDF
ncbi:MAG: REP-associated tyrosine transposase [Armatimonadota bacterium]